MSKALKISICFNLLLTGFLGLSLIKGLNRKEAAKNRAELPSKKSELPANSPPTTFRWSQLESTNYPTYIANLRQIDCPEQTIRDIVTADVESLYRLRAERLREQWATTQNQSLPGLEAALQQLIAEKKSVLVRLLGPDPNLACANDSVAAAQNAVSMPLVWQNVDLSNLNLEEGQMQAIAALQQNFLDQIGGTNQDPNDPAYRERWQKAQPQIDDALAGMIGRKAYLGYGVLSQNSSLH
ncbi:MAG TPA: hypothetical protein VFB72_16850 [Verrucomicrobiae bacterium]|nr:hypothetical protein [Verrucomicrobiae bacterium]